MTQEQAAYLRAKKLYSKAVAEAKERPRKCPNHFERQQQKVLMNTWH